MPEIPSSAVARGRESTRERIVTASRELFARDGYENTTVKAIAERCGLTDPALYYYFPTKREIFEAVMEDPGVRFPVVAEPFTRESFAAYLRDGFYLWAEHLDILALMLREGLVGDASIRVYSDREQERLEAAALPALRNLYGDHSVEVLRTATQFLAGILFDALLAHRQNTFEVVTGDAFRARVQRLTELIVPEETG